MGINRKLAAAFALALAFAPAAASARHYTHAMRHHHHHRRLLGWPLGGRLGRQRSDRDQHSRRTGGVLRIWRRDEPRGLEPRDGASHQLRREQHRRDHDPHRAEHGARDNQDGPGEWDGGVEAAVKRAGQQDPCPNLNEERGN